MDFVYVGLGIALWGAMAWLVKALARLAPAVPGQRAAMAQEPRS